MTLPKAIRSTTLALQVMISGLVQDSLTEGAPRMPLTVRLIDRDTGGDYPLLGRVSPDGTFAFYGSPETAFPRLAIQVYHLRVEARAPNYQPASINFDLGPDGGQPALVTRPITTAGFDDTQVRLFTGGGLPRSDINLNLDQEAVRLKGRVFVSDDPATAVSNAQLTLNPPVIPSTITDAEGGFEFSSPLPVTRTIVILITATNFEPSEITYEPDYTQLINNLTISLRRS